MQPDSELKVLLERSSNRFGVPFEIQQMQVAAFPDKKVLVVGAGGLGCELLKDLALSGFKDVHVIDLDTIELSNLNRQFLFRRKDVGRPKSEVAAEFVMNRCKGIKITPHTKKIQTFPTSFYKQFDIVIAGLDNVEARRWLNSTLVDLVDFDEDDNLDPSTIIPLIDGGTEGFKGQARLFIPHMSSCYECSVNTLPRQRAFAVCTIANVPRLPEHCVAYAKSMMFPKLLRLTTSTDFELYAPKGEEDKFQPNSVKLDTDNVEHMTWIYERAAERAHKFNIQGVTYSLTMQVVKNIIPAIASTNALISAACVNEALKFCTFSSLSLDNYFQYMGQSGTAGSFTFKHERLEECLVCSAKHVSMSLSKSNTVEDLLTKLKEDPHTRLKNPSVSGHKVLFMSSKAMRGMYEENLSKPLSDLVSSGELLVVTDVTLGKRKVNVKLDLTE